MVAKCANPKCNREFRQLSKGRLYILPPTEASLTTIQNLSDCSYWLCEECSELFLITRRGCEVIVNERQ